MKKNVAIIILGALLIFASYKYITQYFDYKKEKSNLAKNVEKEVKKVIFDTQNGGQAVKTEYIETKSPPEKIKVYIDTISKNLNIKENQIIEQNRIIAELKGQLSKKDIVSKTPEKIIYKTEYILVDINQKDSTVNYSYNAKIDLTKIEERDNIFKPKKIYTIASSPDPNFKINGLDSWKKEVVIRKDIFSASVFTDYSILRTDNVINIATGGLILKLNPDSRITPYIKGGYLFNLNNSSLYQFFSIGAEYQILKF